MVLTCLLLKSEQSTTDSVVVVKSTVVRNTDNHAASVFLHHLHQLSSTHSLTLLCYRVLVVLLTYGTLNSSVQPAS